METGRELRAKGQHTVLPVPAAPQLQGLFVAFHFSQDAEFKQNSQKWPWLVQSKPVPSLQGWADL